jgi:hypothetical protein
MSGSTSRIRARRRPAAAASGFRAATFCTTIWNRASCRSSPARSGAAICNTPRCGRRRSGSPRSRSSSARCRPRSSPSLAGPLLQERARAHVRDRRRLQRGISRARRCRLPGDPDRRAADPSDRSAQDPGQGDHAGIDGRGLQSHREGAARQDRSVGAFLLGQSFAAAHVRAGAELQAGAGDLQHGRRRRHHVRILELRRHRSGGDRQDHHRKEDRHRRHRPSHAAGGKSGRGGGANPRRAQIHPARTAGDLDRLRHGARGHEPPPRLYKMVSLVLGTNMVRKELGIPEAECLAADERYSLVSVCHPTVGGSARS